MTNNRSSPETGYGPCVICGDTNYALSCGGPMICPKCDCGNFDAATVSKQAKVIAGLRQQLEEATARGDLYHEENNQFFKRAVEAETRAGVAQAQSTEPAAYYGLLPSPETMLTYASILEKPQYQIDPKTGQKYLLATGEIVEAACMALRLCARRVANAEETEALSPVSSTEQRYPHGHPYKADAPFDPAAQEIMGVAVTSKTQAPK